VKTWEQLTPTMQGRYYRLGDARVPVGWLPPTAPRPSTYKPRKLVADTMNELVTIRRGMSTVEVPRWFIEGRPELPKVRRKMAKFRIVE
jgi:hypothetical protein